MSHHSLAGESSVDGNMQHEDDDPVMPEVVGSIRLPATVENAVFHVTSMMLHLLQMKGLFGGQPSEDVNRHMKNFLEICQPFNITNISQKSIRLRLFPFSLTGEATMWLEELPLRCITSWQELTEAFLDRFFPPSKMLQLRDDITNFRQESSEPLHET